MLIVLFIYNDETFKLALPGLTLFLCKMVSCLRSNGILLVTLLNDIKYDVLVLILF